MDSKGQGRKDAQNMRLSMCNSLVQVSLIPTLVYSAHVSGDQILDAAAAVDCCRFALILWSQPVLARVFLLRYGQVADGLGPLLLIYLRLQCDLSRDVELCLIRIRCFISTG